MADTHGHSVFETNKVNKCLMLNIYVFTLYICSGHFFSETQCKLSFLKHRDIFLFHTQLFYWHPGQRAETELLWW